MANELHAEADTGLTVYAVLLNSTGRAWNGAAFEVINPANWLTYDLAMTEATAGIYLANMPAAIAGAYSYVAYEQAGVNPAITDETLGTGYLLWDGTNEIVPAQAGDQMDLVNAPNAVAVAAIAASVMAAMFAHVTDGYTYDQITALVAAAVLGKSSGWATASPVYRSIDDSADRVSGTVDLNGNRTSVVLTP